MSALRWSLVAVVCLASVAFAQEPRPTVAPFTLELKRTPSGFSKKEKEDLTRVLPLLLRAAGAMVPDAARMNASLAELKRQDCEREDACLSQLATLAGTLYAVHVSVDYTLEKHVVVSGRVVRDDGVVSRALQTIDIVKEGAFREVARDGINQLLSKLDVGRLPSVREVKKDPEPVVKKDPDPVVTRKDPDPVFPPPPLPPAVDLGEGQRAAGRGLVIGGAVLAGLSGALAGVGAGVGYGVEREGDVATTVEGAQTAATARTLVSAGLIGAGVGVAAVAVGAVVWATAPAAPGPKLAVVPVAGGAVVQLGGRF